jgi:ABC-type sulfate transport system permease subunit
VTVDQITAAAWQRDLWLDVVLVLVPVTLLFVVFGRALAERVVRRFMPDDPGVAIFVILLVAPFAAGVGFLFGEMWAWLVEMVRVHESHLSYRVERLPWVRHSLVIFLVYVGVFLVLAWTRYRKPRSTTTEAPPPL